ncbi:hypothetical protein [Geminocystis sp. NIES-3709]|uniref:hypothetical protein n=1 Tax=Geminocystis sp. NIES-3709 TaxID=1617448 RepID=UPI0005FC54F7|nr:hypothetical protein [Geminocystis sp. NIES-3709]BAQ67084.1 hypothetical protein GM3709_3849 [Geminocystis sp. NIES-3709]
MIESKKKLYNLRNAIVENDINTIVEITGCPPENAELLWNAVRLAMGNTNLVRSRSKRTDKTIFARKWEHTPTRTIRVPVCFADDILRYAHDLDLDTDIYSKLQTILKKHKSKAKGYTTNSAGELVKDITALVNSA